MTKTVLLVDDAVMFLEILKDFLKMSSLKVLTARDGLEALEVLKRERPDLIIMDLHMPRMDGAECCAAIKADPNYRAIPVIMATSATKEEDHELCKRSGCDNLITKPFERGLFLNAIRHYFPELDRRDTRVPLSVKVRFQAFRVTMSGTILDLSKRGIFVATDFELDVGTEVVLTFSLEENDLSLIQAKGVVRWRNTMSDRKNSQYPDGFGLEFTALTTESISSLERYLVTKSA